MMTHDATPTRLPFKKTTATLPLWLLGGLLALLLFLPGCQPDRGVAPKPARGDEAGKTAAREAAISQTLTRIDGTTVPVECRQETLAT
ncbi:MAG: hypothetical protein ICV83_33590, partial [Cytophagales bacterium]|nr:hypothetical protein [Cytophagales bacterium]